MNVSDELGADKVICKLINMSFEINLIGQTTKQNGLVGILEDSRKQNSRGLMTTPRCTVLRRGNRNCIH